MRAESKEQAENLLASYRDITDEIAPTLALLKEIEEAVKAWVLASGEDIKVDGAATSTRGGYIRSSWDGAKLKGYAVARPEILEFMTATEVGPSVSIKLLMEAK